MVYTPVDKCILQSILSEIGIFSKTSRSKRETNVNLNLYTGMRKYVYRLLTCQVVELNWKFIDGMHNN